MPNPNEKLGNNHQAEQSDALDLAKHSFEGAPQQTNNDLSQCHDSSTNLSEQLAPRGSEKTTFHFQNGPGHEAITIPEWAPAGICYQIFVDRFAIGGGADKRETVDGRNYTKWGDNPGSKSFMGGNLRGITERLERLQKMGVNVIYLSPIFHCENDAPHGYHIKDFYRIDPGFGTLDDFRAMIQKAHRLEMKVVLDMVFNHVGRSFQPWQDVVEKGENSPHYKWFFPDDGKAIEGGKKSKFHDWLARKAREGKKSKFHDWFVRKLGCEKPRYGPNRNEKADLEKKIKKETANLTLEKRQEAAERISKEYLGYQCWAGVYDLIQLRTEEKEVQNYLLNVARYWIDQGVDGFRLDAPDALREKNFWNRLRSEVIETLPEEKKRNFYLCGELWRDAGDYIDNGKRFHGAMNYPLGLTILKMLINRTPKEDVTGDAEHYKVTPTRPRQATAEIIEIFKSRHGCQPLAQLNVLASHDTARLFSFLENNLESVKMAFALQNAMPGIPCIYNGDEYAMSGESKGHILSRPCVPSPDEEENLPDQRKAVKELLKQCWDLRSQSEALQSGSLTLLNLYEKNENILGLLRRAQKGEDAVLVLANVGGEETTITIDLNDSLDIQSDQSLNWQCILSSSGRPIQPELRANGSIAITIPGRTVIYLQRVQNKK